MTMGPIYNVDQIAQESTDRRGRPIARLVKAAVPSAPRARPRGALLTLVALCARKALTDEVLVEVAMAGNEQRA